MKKYNYVICGCGKNHDEIKKFYHLSDILDKFDRVSFVKNVRHAGVMSLMNSGFYTCKCLQKEAIKEIQNVFSVDNLTTEYYRFKSDINRYQNTIGISVGSFSIYVNYQKIYCGVHISFQILNDKPRFVVSYSTNSSCLHLSPEESIESEDIDEFISKIKDRTTELIGEMKELMSEYSAFTPKVIEKEKWKKRQKEGIEAAKKRGVHTGRPAASMPDNFTEVYTKWKAGLITARAAMKATGLAPSTFYRIVSKIKEDE